MFDCHRIIISMRSVRTERLYLNYQFIVQFIMSFKIAQDGESECMGRNAQIEMKRGIGVAWRIMAIFS